MKTTIAKKEHSLAAALQELGQQIRRGDLTEIGRMVPCGYETVSAYIKGDFKDIELATKILTAGCELVNNRINRIDQAIK